MLSLLSEVQLYYNAFKTKMKMQINLLKTLLATCWMILEVWSSTVNASPSSTATTTITITIIYDLRNLDRQVKQKTIQADCCA